MKKATAKKTSCLFIILGIVLLAYSILLLSVLAWGIINSFKTYQNFHKDPVGFPSKWQFKNYLTAFSYLKVTVNARIIGIYEMFFNSIMYVVFGALLTVTVQCLTAYLCVRFPCKFSLLLRGVVIATMAIPLVGTESSTIIVLMRLNLYDTIFGAWFMRSYFIGTYFLVFYSSFKSLPASYREAAEIDGAGNFNIMFRIMFPLVRNIYLTIFLLNFISLWNDYNVPLLFIPSMPTIAYGVWYYCGAQDNATASIPMKLAGCMLLLLPVLVIFLIFNKRLLEGVSMGGVKE